MIEHVKAQNWTAVTLDFLIVVVGVFMGIQLGNWNEGLNERQRGENYRERLSEEMTNNKQTLIGRRESYLSQIDYGLQALEATTEPTDREAAWEIIHSFFQASHAFTITMQRGTYDEIISSGDLALLDGRELINALSEFYSFSGFSTIEVIPDYRENVRRIIPYHLQYYLQTECYAVDDNDIHQLLDCPPPDGAEGLIELALDLLADEELRRDLQYMVSFSGVSGQIATTLTDRTDRLLELLARDKPEAEARH
jgi:hypothetical protein